MLQKCVFSTSEVQEGMVEKNHIVDFSYKNSFYQSSWPFDEHIPFLVVDSTKISQISRCLHQITCQKAYF